MTDSERPTRKGRLGKADSERPGANPATGLRQFKLRTVALEEAVRVALEEAVRVDLEEVVRVSVSSRRRNGATAEDPR